MSTYNLDQIFKPKRIALFGVTQNPKSVSGRVLSNLVGGGFTALCIQLIMRSRLS
jgi:acetyltransferase